MISSKQITSKEGSGENDWMKPSYAYSRPLTLDIFTPRYPGSKDKGPLGLWFLDAWGDTDTRSLSSGKTPRPQRWDSLLSFMSLPLCLYLYSLYSFNKLFCLLLARAWFPSCAKPRTLLVGPMGPPRPRVLRLGLPAINRRVFPEREICAKRPPKELEDWRTKPISPALWEMVF